MWFLPSPCPHSVWHCPLTEESFYYANTFVTFDSPCSFVNSCLFLSLLSCPLYHADWLFYLWQIHFSSSPSIVNLQAFCDIAQQFQVFSLTWYFFHCPSILQQTFSFAKLVWMWTILTAGNPRNKFYLCPALCLHAQYMTFGVTHSLKDVGFLAENWWCTRDFARYCYKTFSILVH